MIYYTKSSGPGAQLWSTSATGGGQLLATLERQIEYLTTVGGSLYFLGSDLTNGDELWISRGTPGSTGLLKDINPSSASSDPYRFKALDDIVIFVAYEPINGTELWRSDGTTTGTTLVKDIYPGVQGSSPIYFANLNGKLLFAIDDPNRSFNLWISDGTTAGTSLLKNVYVNGDFKGATFGILEPVR